MHRSPVQLLKIAFRQYIPVFCYYKQSSVKTQIHGPSWIYTLNFFKLESTQFLSQKLLGYSLCICLVKTAKNFSKVVVKLYDPTTTYENSNCSTFSPKLVKKKEELKNFTILMALKWISFWFCVFLIRSDVGHLFTHFLTIMIYYSMKCLFKSFEH